jgi:Transglutaminase-like superfamily
MALRCFRFFCMLSFVFCFLSLRTSVCSAENGLKLKAPKILPEGCVDTSSVDAICKSLFKKDMSDHQKTLALYHWFRRLVFHYRNMGADRRHVLRVINSYGYNLCGSQAGCLLVILKHAGIKARPVMVDAGPGYGGHTCVEVFYDDKWHVFDTMTNFCVLNRGEKPSIAGLADIARDPTLVTKAEAEKRTVGGFLTCRHKPAIHYGNTDKLKKLGWKKDFRWATLAFGADGKAGDLISFWSQGPARRWKAIGKTGSLYGGKDDAGLMDFSLKVNERWVMLWDNLDIWTVQPTYPKLGPMHTCGHTDEKDTVNFKYFEPYLREKLGPTAKCYRHYGNGFLEWTPKSDQQRAAGTSFKANGELLVPLRAPGAIVGGVVDFEVLKSADAAAGGIVLELVHGGKTKVKFWEQAAVTAGKQSISLPNVDTSRPFIKADLRFKFPKGVQVKITRVKTIYQLNIYALPTLKPGKNIIHVSGANALPKGTRLSVNYQWRDGDGWKSKVARQKSLQVLPAKFVLEVSGSKMPRMERLEVILLPVTR